MKYIELTADVAIKGEHIERGTVLALNADDPAIGNILSAGRGREVDEAAYKAFGAKPARPTKAAA